jgi:hypothetical protein
LANLFFCHQLEVTNLLVGMGSAVSVATAQHGNSIRGFFHLSMFGLKSLPIPHDASAAEFKVALEAGLHPKLLRAHVWRQDPTTGGCGGGGFVDSAGNGVDDPGGLGSAFEGSGNPPTEEYLYSDLDGRRDPNDPLCQEQTPLPSQSRLTKKGVCCCCCCCYRCRC